MKSFLIRQIIAVVLLSYAIHPASGAAMKLTNLECQSFDETVVVFKECRLKVIGRGQVSLNVYVNVVKPLRNIVVGFGLYKKANGYKPFLFNTTVDFCQVLAKQAQNMIARIAINIVTEYSNLNHSCPYNHDIIINNLYLREEKFKLIPLPSGDYMEQIVANTDNRKIAVVKTYFTRKE